MKRTRIAASVLAVALMLTACEYREVDGVGTRTYDEQYVPQDDLATFDGCVRTAVGQWRVDGEVVNNTPDMATYAITFAFFDGDTRLDERTMWIRDLHPGERSALGRSWWLTSGDRVDRCSVLTIDRLGTPIAAEATTPTE